MKSALATALILSSAFAAPMQNAAALEACTKAPNCETWFNHRSNRTQIRFKKDMGPDTDWYHKNVRLIDPLHPLSLTSGALMRRDGTTYNADRSSDVQKFGTMNPVDVANSMYDNCEAASCENINWSFKTQIQVTSPGTSSPATLNVEAGGQWDSSDPANRGNFIEALKAQAAPSHEEDNVPIAIGGDGTVGYYNFYSAMNYLDINRYVDGNLQGYASMTLSLEDDTADACDVATGILSAAAGTVSGIGGGFFGVAGALTCGIGG